MAHSKERVVSVEEVLRELEALNPNAMLLEPREVYDRALIGVTDDPNDSWPSKARVHVAVYDINRCLEAIMAWLGCDFADAREWFGYNTSGAWVGEGTPTFAILGEGEH